MADVIILAMLFFMSAFQTQFSSQGFPAGSFMRHNGMRTCKVKTLLVWSSGWGKGFAYIVLRVKSSLNSRNTSFLFSNILKLITVKSCYKFQEQKCSYVTRESRQHQTSSFTNAQFSAIQPVTLPTQQNDI